MTELLERELYELSVSIKLCFEANDTCESVFEVLKDVRIPALPCTWTADFINPGYLIII